MEGKSEGAVNMRAALIEEIELKRRRLLDVYEENEK